MSTGASSLRRTERRGAMLVAACLAALTAVLAEPAWAGTAPTPDDPPAGPRNEASPRIAEAPAKASTLPAQATPTTGAESSTPTPDAPPSAQKSSTKPRAEVRPTAPEVVAPKPQPSSTPAPQPASTPTPQPARASSPAPGESSARQAPTAGAMQPPATGATHRNDVRRAKRHPARPVGSARPKKTAAPPRVVSVPRDGNRPGLPVGTLTLSAVAGDSNRAALLAAAALLLVAAGAGGLVVGLAGRRLARVT
jgi:hypothetical protein